MRGYTLRTNYGGMLPGFTPAVKYLIIVNVALFLLSIVLPGLSRVFGLVPVLFWKGALWQPMTYLFLHGGVFHLVFNMLALWMFGSTLEGTWGTKKFMTFYFVCGAGAGLLDALILRGSAFPAIGASGAIYGLLMAFAVLFPNELIYFWGIFPIKAKFFVLGIGVVELLSEMSGSRSGIAHLIHLSGMLFGLLYLKGGQVLGAAAADKAERTRRKHLKILAAHAKEQDSAQREIDALLDKINRDGPDSLSPAERRRFSELAEKMRKLEKKS